MPETTFPDEWLVQSLEGLVDAERLAELRGKAAEGWDADWIEEPITLCQVDDHPV